MYFFDYHRIMKTWSLIDNSGSFFMSYIINSSERFYKAFTTILTQKNLLQKDFDIFHKPLFAFCFFSSSVFTPFTSLFSKLFIVFSDSIRLAHLYMFWFYIHAKQLKVAWNYSNHLNQLQSQSALRNLGKFYELFKITCYHLKISRIAFVFFYFKIFCYFFFFKYMDNNGKLKAFKL